VALQTILGAGGVIGTPLAQILLRYAEQVRLVSRRPPVLDGYETVAADLTKAEEVLRAVEGSRVCYLVAGLPYDARVWEALWPVVMRNTLDACRTHGARLVFFDNVYMYDRDRLDGMTESTPIRPTSRKGAVRARIAQMLMDAVDAGHVEALIARSADFYGPGRQQQSIIGRSVLERLTCARAAQWLMSADRKHAFTFTPDAALGTAMLGNADDAYGSIWHLPTASAPLTGREWVEAAARHLDVPARLQVAGPTLLALMGMVARPVRELKEMAYQYDRDYVFLSGKFEQRFGFTPTTYAEGLAAILATDYAA
jgi:nucleoside-diphosphate-sugar epimerase